MNKRQFYDPSDIKGARSNTLHRQTNVRDNTMRVDDIDGAVPTPYTFVTKREVDPLVPKYKLPSYQPAPDAPPKFVRDSYNVSDIAGTKPKPLFRFQQRNSTVNDIEGAQPGWKPRHQRVRHESNPITHQFNVRDITDTGFKSTRVTDPLRPQYTVNGEAPPRAPAALAPPLPPRQPPPPPAAATTTRPAVTHLTSLTSPHLAHTHPPLRQACT